MMGPDQGEDGVLSEALTHLVAGRLYRFADWPTVEVPRGLPGVYAIWRSDEFLYVGMSYRHRGDSASPNAAGLIGRLASHASGRRSGDQFNIYICDRFVIPKLSLEQLRQLEEGVRLLDGLTRHFILENLSYRAWIAQSGDDARRVEAYVMRDGLPGHGHPLINPRQQ